MPILGGTLHEIRATIQNMAKKKHEEHENHERWLVSYADFITLLFAFFVVMYSISAVNEGKFRTVSDSIKAALNPMNAQPAGAAAFQVGASKLGAMIPTVQRGREHVIRQLRALVKDLEKSAEMHVAPVVEQRAGDIVLTISDTVMFKSGEATLRPEILPFLEGLAHVLVELDRQVRIEGHTDNVPIRTAQFPSNWDLSAARAVIIVRVLSELYDVPITHLAAVGYAESRPLTPNLTPEDRAKNRRVEVVIVERLPAAQPLGVSDAAQIPEDTLPTSLLPPQPQR
jgi:chemotaxis protein MotB